jgi:beta-mannanase
MAAALFFAVLTLPSAALAEVRFGVHTDGAVYDGGVTRIDALERKIDRRIAIVSWYQQWAGDWISQLHPELVRAVTDSGRSPLLTWEPWDPAKGPDQARFSLSRIARGEFDDYAARWARKLRDLDTRVFLRPMHEMNGDWYPWAGDADDYRAAWRRLHDVFERVGADNVRWVWCVNNTDARGRRMERFYPGDRYVDVLAMDGYNWGSTKPEWGGWQSFHDVFASAYRRLRQLGDQPIWVAEVGSAPEGGDKTRWVRNMWETAERWDRLKAIVWFDVDKERDWTLP